jgi:hypothetical protein
MFEQIHKFISDAQRQVEKVRYFARVITWLADSFSQIPKPPTNAKDKPSVEGE